MRFLKRFSVLLEATLPALAALGALCVGGSLGQEHFAGAQTSSKSCPSSDAGLKLPAGFCATVFADNIGHARHLVISSNGVVYVNTWSGDYYPPGDKPPAGGFLLALQDKTGDGKADVIERFGETMRSGGAGGTGIGTYNGFLYAEINDRIVRYEIPTGSIVPTGPEVTVVTGLPLGGDHPMHPFTITADGSLDVDVGTATNSCQFKNRTLKSPGADPCTELETRGGIWLFDANKTNQQFTSAHRYATGIRNGEGFAVDAAAKRIFVTQHGRDQLHSNWPDLYKLEEEATLPAEELLVLKKGGDYGWPECYYDPAQRKLVLAPEYGGDGGKKVGVCASKIPPVAVFPAHWGPNAAVLYDQKHFPAHYRNGVFIAFHGSWNRSPFAQAGYNVVFQPMAGDDSSGPCELFADGFAGAVKSPEKALYRPSGLALGPDGALYIADDNSGRIYRVVYVGGDAGGGPKFTPCPSATGSPGPIVRATAKPPEGTNPDAGVTLPAGATKELVGLGDRIYHGEVGGAACAGCHGSSAKGTPLGPDLTDSKWLWSDGSYEGIAKTITEGVSRPKEYRNAMPAMGGAQLTDEQVKALAAYVWSLSHH
jgi:glucose/arabinose dehydrogenase/mono/diheme cytochrome c family protein